MVYLGYRGYVSGSAGKETLLGSIEFAAVNLSLYCFYTQFISCQFYYCIAGNTYEDTIITGRRD